MCEIDSIVLKEQFLDVELRHFVYIGNKVASAEEYINFDIALSIVLMAINF